MFKYWNCHGDELLTLNNSNKIDLFKVVKKRKKNKIILKTDIFMKNRIYDLEWIPYSRKRLFAITGADIPIELWDLDSCLKIQNYQTLNYYGTYEKGITICCPYTGEFIVSGFKKKILIFDLERPYTSYSIKTTKGNKLGKKNYLSCIEFLPNSNNIFLVGSYDGYMQIFDMRQFYSINRFKCQLQGLTCIKGSICQNFIFTSSRRNDEIWCWDTRKLPTDSPGGSEKNIRIYKQTKSIIFKVFSRSNPSNQLLPFDLALDGSFLVTPSFDGTAKFYSLKKNYSTSPIHSVVHFTPYVNCTKLAPNKKILVTCTGTRTFGFEKTKNQLLFWNLA